MSRRIRFWGKKRGQRRTGANGRGSRSEAGGGAATAATTAISDPSALQRPRELGASVGVGALVGGLAYLKTHPPVDAGPESWQPITAAATAAAA